MDKLLARAVATIAMIAVVGAGAANAQAISRTVPMTLNLQAAVSFSVQAKNIADDLDATGLSFGPIASGQNYALSNQYVELAVTAPGVSWKIRTYTNNGPYPGQTYRSGLVGLTDSSVRLPTKWYALDAPVAGGPQFNDAASADQFAWHKDPGDNDWNPTMDYLTVLNGTGGSAVVAGGANNGAAVSMPATCYIGTQDLATATPQAYAGTVFFDLIQL